MVNPIEPPDSHHLLSAQGWAELGDYQEAEAALMQIAPKLRAHPQVLAVRYEIYARSKRWDQAADVATRLVDGFAHHAGDLGVPRLRRPAQNRRRPAPGP